MGRDPGEARDENQVENKPEIIEGHEAYDTFVANTMIAIDCLLMLRSESRCVICQLIFLFFSFLILKAASQGVRE